MQSIIRWPIGTNTNDVYYVDVELGKTTALDIKEQLYAQTKRPVGDQKIVIQDSEIYDQTVIVEEVIEMGLATVFFSQWFFLKTLANRNPVRMKVFPGFTTVGDLKAAFSKENAIPPEKLKIVFAGRRLEPDDFVIPKYVIDEGTAVVVPPLSESISCGYCRKQAKYLCAACGQVTYCSAGCQKKDWARHTTACSH